MHNPYEPMLMYKESMAKVGGTPFQIVEAVLLGAAKHEMERDLPAIG